MKGPIFLLVTAMALSGVVHAESYQLRVKVPGMVAPVTEQPSCKAWLEAGETQSGNYTIRPKGSDQPFEVYCDMSYNGGGWTKIGQRVYDSSGSDSRVLITNLIPVIPEYSQVRQPAFAIRDCSSCSANSWTLKDENGVVIDSGGSRSMNGSSAKTVYASTSNLIYWAQWSGMSNGIGYAGEVYVR
jgi:hypothetical protein